MWYKSDACFTEHVKRKSFIFPIQTVGKILDLICVVKRAPAPLFGQQIQKAINTVNLQFLKVKIHPNEKCPNINCLIPEKFLWDVSSLKYKEFNVFDI